MRVRSLSLRLPGSVLGAWLLIAPSATAQSAEDLLTAREHFHAARRLEQKQDWAAAANELRAALKIKETPGLRYHLAYCQEQLADYGAALTDFERAKQLLGEGQQAADVSRLVGPAIERVRAQVGELTVLVPDSGPWQVFLDGNEIEAGEAQLVNPGLHIVRALRADHEQRHEIAVAARGEHRLELEPPPSQIDRPQPALARTSIAMPADRTSPEASPSSKLKLPLLVGEGALTALSVGVAIGFTLRANQAKHEADLALSDIDARDPGRQCGSNQLDVRSACSQLADLKQREADDRSVARWGFIGAGAGAALFVATWLLWPDEASTQSEARKPRILARLDGESGFVGVFGGF